MSRLGDDKEIAEGGGVQGSADLKEDLSGHAQQSERGDGHGSAVASRQARGSIRRKVNGAHGGEPRSIKR